MGDREFSGDDCRAGRALCCCRVLHQTWLRPINSHAAQPVHGTTRHGYTFAAAAGRRCPESSLTPNTACLSIRHKRSFIAFDALNFETGLLQLQQSETGLCCFTAQSTTTVLPFNRRCMSTAGGGAGPQVMHCGGAACSCSQHHLPLCSKQLQTAAPPAFGTAARHRRPPRTELLVSLPCVKQDPDC